MEQTTFTTENRVLPCYYISHGGPPLVLNHDDKAYNFLKSWGEKILNEIKPKAIVVISAHWETDDTIKVGSFDNTTPIIYDYYGFPDKMYKLKYHSKGSPELAKKIVDLLNESKIKSEIENKRGLDHGCWIPLKIAIPDPKDLPIIQVSLKRHASYDFHIKVGKALASLRKQGVLIIGSGSLIHNLRDMNIHNMFSLAPYSQPFEKDVDSYVTNFVGNEREQKLIKDLSSHPLLRKAHPTDDHLVPLHCAVGSAGSDPGRKIYEELISSLSMGVYEFAKN
ncbi:10252_t:CDS:2 [Entrophospora sp. SA101]|nr:14349_t:CDS:2 [Entrophospora sp. SA101]CAJ0909635.1 10252_t:CDS:2 [Entrophospora sp. SA101]